MSLTAVSITVSLGWLDQKTITGLRTASYNGSFQTTIEPTVGSGSAREVYFIQSTLAAGASSTINLSSIAATVYNNTVTPSGAYIVKVYGTGATWRYDGGAANPLEWFLNAGGQINGDSGALFTYASPTATSISGTDETVRITNTHGSATLTYSIGIVLKAT